jgi:hypothetical protein
MSTIWHEYLGEGGDESHAPFALGLSTSAPPVVEPIRCSTTSNVPVVLVVAADLNKIA